MRELGVACEFAAREGWVQTFVEEGRALRIVLAQYAESVQPEAAGDDTPTVTELLRRVMKPHGGALARAVGAVDTTLTAKEQRVLHLLASGDSNEAIAERLFVSTSTVRTHLRSINAKLKANSRVLTGEPFSAQRALMANMVSRVVPHDDLMPATEDLVSRILRNDQAAIQSAKETINEVIGRPLYDQLRVEAMWGYALCGGNQSVMGRSQQFF